ncbi:MAG: glycosyltransferase family 4 protein [Woeseiaceae bacterium]
MKYIYVKNGDAVDQLYRISRADFQVSPNGPDAFIGSFLSTTRGCEVILVSRGTRRADLQMGNIVAHTRAGGRGTAGQVWHRLRFAVYLALKIMSVRPDRVICGSTGSQLLVCWATCKLIGAPLVHSRHNSISEPAGNPLDRLRRNLDVFLIRRVSAAVVHGPFLRDQLISCGVDATRLFEFDVRFPHAVQEQPAGRKLVLYVGRIELGKGVIDLLDAAVALFHDGIDFRLRFVGDGTALPTLEAQAARTGLQGQIAVSGAVPHDTVLKLMGDATVVVTPTRTEFPEGRCMVALESIAMGVPVIAPNHGPFPYIVRHQENGLLFESNNTESLRECLRRVVLDDRLVARLRNGAVSTSAELGKLQTDFSVAVEQAFKAAALAAV